MTSDINVVPARLVTKDLVRRTFWILKDRPLFYLGLCVAAIVTRALGEKLFVKKLVGLVGKKFLEIAPDGIFSFMGVVWVILGVGLNFLSSVIPAIVAYSVFHRINKCCEVTLDKAVSQVLKQFLPLFWISLVYCIPIFILSVSGFPLSLSAILTIGIMLLLMMVVFGVFFFPLIPVCVIEELGFIASFRRSLKLTSGFREQIFILFIACFLLFMVFGIFVSTTKILFSDSIGRLLSVDGRLIFDQLYSGIINIFVSVLSAVVYYDLVLFHNQKSTSTKT